MENEGFMTFIVLSSDPVCYSRISKYLYNFIFCLILKVIVMKGISTTWKIPSQIHFTYIALSLSVK